MKKQRQKKNSNLKKLLPNLPRSLYLLMAGESEPDLVSENHRKSLVEVLVREEILVFDLAINCFKKLPEKLRTPMTDIFLLAHFRKKCKESNIFQEAQEHAKKMVEEKKEEELQEAKFTDLFSEEHITFFNECLDYAFSKLNAIQEEQDQQALNQYIYQQLVTIIERWDSFFLYMNREQK